MTTFALVHGAWHNATCWNPTAAVLRQRRHDVITMDLPCSDPAAGLEEYTTAVLDAIADVPTHAIVCAEDRVLQADTCARLAEERFEARVTRLSGGHSPMIAQPEALADALTSGLT